MCVYYIYIVLLSMMMNESDKMKCYRNEVVYKENIIFFDILFKEDCIIYYFMC